MKRLTYREMMIVALCCLNGLDVHSVRAAVPAQTPTRPSSAARTLEPARAALRMLQFQKAIALLDAAADAGNAEAEYLLALMYLNGVGVVPDEGRARRLLQNSADHGFGAAAYVLAAELARAPDMPPDTVHGWLQRSALLGYPRAAEALKSGRPLLHREIASDSDPSLLQAWVLECARKNDAAELRRLGTATLGVRDEFGRGPLAYAAAAGALDAAAVLLDLGANVNGTDQGGTTAVMLAAQRSDSRMTELLIGRRADARPVDGEGRTALFYAARANQPANLQLLIRSGAIVEATDERGYNALDDALAVDADAAAAELRARGLSATVMVTSHQRQTGRFDAAHTGEIYRGWPALALAVSRNDSSSVRQLLDSGGDANLRLPQGDSLLQIAVDARAWESLRVLLQHGADVTSADHAGHGALWLAAVRNDVPGLNELLHGGARPDAHATTETTPLLAVLTGPHSLEVVRILLEAGANPENTDVRGHTGLMLAAANGRVDLINLLLAHHARVDAEDPLRRSALWYAAAAGSRSAVQLLLDAGASVESADASGLTVLHAAAAQAASEVFEPLLRSPRSLNRRSAAGDTALLIAAANGHEAVVRALLAGKPELDTQNTTGDTALIAASRGGYAEICQLLIARGANRALRNGAGVSAADVAASRGFNAIAKQLNSAG